MAEFSSIIHTSIHTSIQSVVALVTSHPLILLFVLWFLRAAIRRYYSPLRSFPGPFLASISRTWKFISIARGHTHLDFIALHQKYGPIVRTAPDELSFASPQIARTILSAGKGFYKTSFYAVFPPPENPDIFTEIREDVHAIKKRVANVPYSMAAMRQLSPFIDDTIDLFVSQLAEFCVDLEVGKSVPLDVGGRGKVDLGAWLHYFAFDVLGEVAFSRSFGFLAAGRDVEGAIKTIDDMQTYNGLVGQIPILDYLLRRNPMWKYVLALNPGNSLITRIALDELSKRKPFDENAEGPSKDGRRDLLGSLIKGHLKEGSGFGEGDVFAVAHGAIFAGSDSTASTMQSFFHYILSVPEILGHLQQELKSAMADGSVPKEGNIEYTQALDLSYFQACLKEAMRLRPAVGLNITRHVPKDGIELDGVVLKGDTRVAVNGWVLHRHKETFGQDADVFRPERWLEDEEKAKKMDRFMFQFGGGAHVCIGRNLAILEINKVIPRLLRDFNFELVHPSQPLKAHASFFVVQEGLNVFIEKNSSGV
ncbi:hypothetical protein PFICI_07701 [Pestalotiopsis fici W106-1]|uniref:Pisatin demethylase n=1 Tax=Pestalotiopsis fici (strain W106-1 / CGMCC3.15140) TaxID=1229662 RepID=W3X449_PESFW|nr:uncharacterized protein PFICI_07701 [Pestalotiopsis fici W106-1]ETS80172.1 hypothetical protein PFICI_07701 [Pestalotiopsis fici W106-1]